MNETSKNSGLDKAVSGYVMKRNPFRKGTWSYDFYKEGFDDFMQEDPYKNDNEFASEQWQAGCAERREYYGEVTAKEVIENLPRGQPVVE